MTAFVLLNQSDYLSHSNKDSYYILLYESIEHADHTVVRFENKISFENESGAWGILRILFHQTNREALRVFCSVVKHLASG